VPVPVRVDLVEHPIEGVDVGIVSGEVIAAGPVFNLRRPGRDSPFKLIEDLTAVIGLRA